MEGGQMQAMLLEFLMDQGEPLSASSSEQHHGPVSQQPGPVGTDTVRRPTLSSNTHSGLHQAEAQHPLTNRRSVNGGVAFPSWTLPSITPPANSSPVFAGLASGGSSYPPWTSAPSLQTQSRETQGVAYGNNPPAGSPWTCNPQTPELPPFSSLPHQLPNESFHPLPGGGFGGGNYFEGTRAQLGNGNTNWSNQRPLLSHQTLSNHYSNTSTPAIPTGLDVAPPSSVQMPASTQRNVRAKQRSQEHMLEAQLQAKLAELSVLQAQSTSLQKKLNVLEAVATHTSPQTHLPTHPHTRPAPAPLCAGHRNVLEAVATHTPPHPTPHPNPNPTPTPAPLCAGHRNVLEAVVPVRDSSLAFLTKAAAIMKAPQPRWGAPHIVPSHTSLACSVFLPTNWDSPQALETIRSTSPAQFRALWRSFLRETAFLVLAAEAHGVVSEAHDRLAMLVLQVSVITSSGLQGMGTWQGVVSEARDRLALLGLQVSVIRSSGLQGMGTWQGVVSEARDRLALLGLQVSVITSSGLQGMGTWQGVVSEAHDRLALLVLQVSVITSSGLQGMGTWTGVVSEARDRLALLGLQVGASTPCVCRSCGCEVSVIASSGLQGMGTWQGVVSEARDRLALLVLQVSVITSSGLQGMGTWTGVVSEARDRLAMLLLQVSVITSSGLQGMGTWTGVVSEARDRLAMLLLQVSVITSSGLQGMGTWTGVVSEARDRLAMLLLQVSVITSSGLQGMGTWTGVVSEARDRLAMLLLQVSVITSSGLQGMGTWTGVVSEARDRLAMLLLQVSVIASSGLQGMGTWQGVVSEARDRLAMLLLQAMSVFDKIILLAPDSFAGSMYVHLETGEPAAPDESFWRSVAQALAPSDKQLHHLQNAMDHYQSNETSRVSERSNLTDILLHTLGTSAPSSGAIFRAEFHNEVEELTTLLKRNLLQERAAQCTMADFLSSLVLTPLQVVKMAAVSYPYFPDGVAITHACVQLAAESAPGRKGDLTGLDQGPRTASTDAPQNSGTGKRCVVARATNSD
ncbi:MAG: hypothetical protein WDW36_005604 [Sanguina aurantia]